MNDHYGDVIATVCLTIIGGLGVVAIVVLGIIPLVRHR